MIKNQTSLFNINQYQLDKDFPGLLSVGQEKSIKLFFHGRRLQSVRGRQEKRGGVLVGSLTGTTTGGHVVRLADWLINVVDDVLVGNRSVDHSKSVDHFAPLFGSRLNSLAGYFGSAIAASEMASERMSIICSNCSLAERRVLTQYPANNVWIWAALASSFSHASDS